MLGYTELIGKKVFKAKNLKQAYMKAIKWYSTNIISKEKLNNVMAEYEKDERENKIIINLYIKLDESEIKDRHCKICKETHKAYYINEQFNCTSCSMLAYRKRMQIAAKTKKCYYAGLINGIGGDKNE